MSFHPGPAFGKLTQKTVLYFNPKITPQKPIWATPQNYDASIFAHDFYHDGGVLGRVETA
jgi:hypothetical protein